MNNIMIIEKISAFGHENILCTHKTTIELTKDNYVSVKGNCILGIKASKSCNDLNSNLKKIIRSGNVKVKVTISIGKITDSFFGFGNKDLTLLNKNDIVFRLSEYICDRTVLIKCTKSSKDLNRNLVSKLKSPNTKFYLTFEKENEA